MADQAADSSRKTSPEEAPSATHSLGTGVGIAAGVVAGAAIGSVVGPIGTVVGATAGAVAGGLAGNEAAEAINPSAQAAYWREHHPKQEFVGAGRSYDDYVLIYRVGYMGYREGETFEQREAALRMEYEAALRRPEETVPGTMQYNMSTNPLRWDEGREAARAAYERVERGKPAGTMPD